jgi:hypothetical protein
MYIIVKLHFTKEKAFSFTVEDPWFSDKMNGWTEAANGWESLL